MTARVIIFGLLAVSISLTFSRSHAGDIPVDLPGFELGLGPGGFVTGFGGSTWSQPSGTSGVINIQDSSVIASGGGTAGHIAFFSGSASIAQNLEIGGMPFEVAVGTYTVSFDLGTRPGFEFAGTFSVELLDTTTNTVFDVIGSNEFTSLGTTMTTETVMFQVDDATGLGDLVLRFVSAGTGQVVIDNVSVAIPEPATLALLGAGLIGAGAVSRTRRQSR